MFGTANPSANVSLWTSGGAYALTSRRSDYFWGELYLSNASAPVYAPITNLALLKNGSNPDVTTNAVGSAGCGRMQTRPRPRQSRTRAEKAKIMSGL